jgi:hypothetical protein
VRRIAVLVDLHGVLGGVVVRLLEDAFGPSSVSEVPVGAPLRDAVTRANPSVLLTALSSGADPTLIPAPLAQMLGDHPHLKILLLEGDGRSGSIWELRPHRIPLGELSPSHLIKAVGGSLAAEVHNDPGGTARTTFERNGP